MFFKGSSDTFINRLHVYEYTNIHIYKYTYLHVDVYMCICVDVIFMKFSYTASLFGISNTCILVDEYTSR